MTQRQTKHINVLREWGQMEKNFFFLDLKTNPFLSKVMKKLTGFAMDLTISGVAASSSALIEM